MPPPSDDPQRQVAASFRAEPLASLYDALDDAWREATARSAPDHPPFLPAVAALASAARDAGLRVTDVLRALDALMLPKRGGDDRLDWDHMRQAAGTAAIAAYYHAH